MCELTVLDPRKYTTPNLTEIAMQFYRQQGDSIGLVYVRESEDRTKFEYDIFKAVEPKRAAMADFLGQVGNGAVRLIIHGRMATHGERDMDGAHPIEVDCPECNIDHILHNGIVTQHRQLRKHHEQTGHQYQTNVDTEAIVHDYGTVPENFEYETEYGQHDRQPAFVLLNEERVFIRTSGSYDLSRQGELARSRRTFGPESADADYREVILTPKND